MAELTSFLGNAAAPAVVATPAPAAAPEPAQAPVQPRRRMPRPQQPVEDQDDGGRAEFSQALQDATSEPVEVEQTATETTPEVPAVNPFAEIAPDLGLPPETLAAMNPADLVKFAVGLMKQNQTQQKEWLGEYQKLLAATPQTQQTQPEQPTSPLDRLLAPDKYDPEFVAPIVEAFNAQKAELDAMKAQLAEAMGTVKSVKQTAQQQQFEAIDTAFNNLTTHHGLFGKVQPVKGSPEYMRRVAVLQSLQVAPIPGMRPEQAVLKRANEMFPTVAATPVTPQIPQAIQDRRQQWQQNGPLAQANAKQPSPMDEGEAQRLAFSKYLKEIQTAQ